SSWHAAAHHELALSPLSETAMGARLPGEASWQGGLAMVPGVRARCRWVALAWLALAGVALGQQTASPPRPVPAMPGPATPSPSPSPARTEPAIAPPVNSASNDRGDGLLAGDPLLACPQYPPPGWFAGVELSYVKPHIKNHLVEDVSVVEAK